MRIYEHKNKTPPFIRGIRVPIRQIRFGLSAGVGRTQGFTLLFAVLIGSLLFSVGMAIAHLAVREVVLSAAGKESGAAFFAADTGAECALYWDIRKEIFDGTPGSFRCAGRDIAPTQSGTKALFTVQLGDTADGPCAEVAVDKTNGTTIESRGRNECGTGENPARVERALRVRY